MSAQTDLDNLVRKYHWDLETQLALVVNYGDKVDRALVKGTLPPAFREFLADVERLYLSFTKPKAPGVPEATEVTEVTEAIEATKVTEVPDIPGDTPPEEASVPRAPVLHKATLHLDSSVAASLSAQLDENSPYLGAILRQWSVPFPMDSSVTGEFVVRAGTGGRYYMDARLCEGKKAVVVAKPRLELNGEYRFSYRGAVYLVVVD